MLDYVAYNPYYSILPAVLQVKMKHFGTNIAICLNGFSGFMHFVQYNEIHLCFLFIFTGAVFVKFS